HRGCAGFSAARGAASCRAPSSDHSRRPIGTIISSPTALFIPDGAFLQFLDSEPDRSDRASSRALPHRPDRSPGAMDQTNARGSEEVTTGGDHALRVDATDRARPMLHRLGRSACDDLCRRAAAHDRDGSFPMENIEDMKRSGAMFATLRAEMGGLGLESL